MPLQYPFTSFRRSVAAAGLALSAATLGACGSGDSDDQTSDTGGSNVAASNDNGSGSRESLSFTPVGGDEDEAVDVCQDFDFAYDPDDLQQPTGSAHLTPNPGDPEPGMDLPEVTCEVLRDAAGNVAGFFASFFASWEESFLTDAFATVEWVGDFTGAGEYADASLDYGVDLSVVDDPTFVYGPLVIENGGLSGRISGTNNSGDRAELSFQCGDATKLGLGTVPWSERPAPGRARIVRRDGVVQEFPNTQCSTNGDDFELRTYSIPYDFILEANGTGTGRHTLDSWKFDYAGSDTYSSYGGAMDLDCGSTPVSGTFQTDTQTGIQGVFTCQH
jgi:hypothetical protein